MKKHLNSSLFTWKELAKLAKALNGGPLGLSPKMEVNELTRTKEALAGYIVTRWTPEKINAQIFNLDISAGRPGHERQLKAEDAKLPIEPEPTPAPTPQTVDADNGEGEAEKYRKIKEILGGTEISEAKVSEMIAAALDKRPVKRETLIIKEGIEREVQGTPHKRIKEACLKVSANVNTMLYGAPGCGKTFLARQTAEALGLDYAYISCNGGTTPEDLFGRLLPTGEGAKFEWHDSPLTRIVENGGLFLWDELDALPADMLFTCQMLLSDRALTIPSRIHKPQIIAHKDFRAMATCNSLGNGGGAGMQREIQDSAAFDRWKAGRIECEYDLDVERAISHPAVFAWAVEIREQIVTKKIQKLMTTRNMADFTALADAGETRADWEKAYFLDWTRDEMSKIGRKAAA